MFDKMSGWGRVGRGPLIGIICNVRHLDSSLSILTARLHTSSNVDMTCPSIILINIKP